MEDLSAEDLEEIVAVAGQILLKAVESGESIDSQDGDTSGVSLVEDAYATARHFNKMHKELWEEVFPEPPEEVPDVTN